MSIAKKVGKGGGDSPLFPMFRVWIFVTHHRLAGYEYTLNSFVFSAVGLKKVCLSFTFTV